MRDVQVTVDDLVRMIGEREVMLAQLRAQVAALTAQLEKAEKDKSNGK